MAMSISTYEAITNLLQAKSGDTEEVRWALETAHAVWTNGDHREALRWLRRAAEIASEEGLDLRAVALARIAAELRTELELPASVPPPPDSHARVVTSKMEALPPPPVLTLEATEAQPPQRETLAATPPPRPATVKASIVRPPPPQSLQNGSIGSASARPRPAVRTDPGLSPALAAQARAAPDAPPALEQSSDLAGKFQMLRVLIRANSDGTLSATPCEPDTPTPAGFHPALVIALDPGIDLLGDGKDV